MLILSKNIIYILKRTLNLLDYRIVDHCERVAYIVLEMLKEEGGYSQEELVSIYFLCALHDIGAFKTEHIDVLLDISEEMIFEIKNTLPHAVYGYLFIESFSTLSEYADAILYHHTRYDILNRSSCRNKALAAKIFLADRLDVLMMCSDFTIDEQLFSEYRNTVFSSKDIDILITLEKKYAIGSVVKSGSYAKELCSFYDTMILTEEQSIGFLRSIIFSIDFRSEYTVLHTIMTLAFSIEIAKLMKLSDDEVHNIFYGSLLHDIGKIATSSLLLEKSSSLNDYEYTLMKDHVIVSENILKDLINENIFKIAVRHHEKLDGSGYPHGLTAKDLSISECIVAVADIMSALLGKRSYKDSFPEERVKEILRDSINKNKIHAEIGTLAIQNFPLIVTNAQNIATEWLEKYNTLSVQ